MKPANAAGSSAPTIAPTIAPASATTAAPTAPGAVSVAAAPTSRGAVGVPAEAAPLTAQQLADRAYELHAAGRYPEAIALYLKAYEGSHSGVTLLNVATIYDRKLGERALATEYYRRYLHAPDADPDLVRRANERILALKREAMAAQATRADTARQAADAPAPGEATPIAIGLSEGSEGVAASETKPSVTTASDVAMGAGALTGATDAGRPRPRANGARTAGYIVGAAGLGGVAAGLVLGLVAKCKNDDANAICHGAACPDSQGVSLAHQAGTFATASTIAVIGGLGLAAGGFAIVLLNPRTTEPSRTTLALSPAFGTAGGRLNVQGSF